MQLENKKIVITGASSGIGLALLKEISKIVGTEIVACGRKIDNIYSAPNIHKFKADVSLPEQVDALFEFAISKMGEVNIFLANAGFGIYEKLRKAEWSHINQIFSTNVISPIYSLTKMIQLNPENEFSVIITCSGIGKLPYPGFALYTGSKFALDGFNDSMQYEMPANGHLQMIYPVATYTGFFTNADMTKNQMPWPRQETSAVVDAVLKGIKKNKTHIYPYKLFPVLYYFAQILPFAKRIFLSTTAQKLKSLD